MTSSSKAETGTWEFCKENIQPLSNGRRITLLNQSLNNGGVASSQAVADEEVDRILKGFEQQIDGYSGSDPLSIWMNYVTYFEQNCLSNGKFQNRYNEVLTNCVKRFLRNAECNNDKRFVEIFIKSCANLPPERRVAVFHNSLKQGVGVGVSLMYLRIAEDYESLNKFSLVSDVVELGKKNQAHPVEYLDEFLTNFQVRVAQRVSRNLKERHEIGTEDTRNFGSSVPLIGPQKDAQNVRTGLLAADPSKARPSVVKDNKEPKKVVIYQQSNGSENAPPPVAKPCINFVNDVELMKDKLDKENMQEPTKWNKPDNMLCHSAPPVSSAPSGKIQIYEDSVVSIVPDNIERRQKKAHRPALNERKIELDEPKQVFPTPGGNTKQNVQIQAQPAVVSITSHTIAAQPMPQYSAPFAGMFSSKKNLNPVGNPAELNPNQRLMCRIKDLFVDGKEVTFEYLRVLDYKRRKQVRRDGTRTNKDMPPQVAIQNVKSHPVHQMGHHLSDSDSHSRELEIENATLKLRIIELEDTLKKLQDRTELDRQNFTRQIEALQQYKEVQPATAVTLLGQGQENGVNKTSTQIERDTDERVNGHMERPFAQDVDETEAILKRNANMEPDFDISNITRALTSQPKPMHCSTPERNDPTKSVYWRPNVEPQNNHSSNPLYQLAKANFNQSMHVAHNLSTIQETSKESRASTTSSSGSNANGGASTFSATSNYTKSAQRTAARSHLGLSGSMPPPPPFHLSQEWN